MAIVGGVFIRFQIVDLGDVGGVPDICTGIEYVDVVFEVPCTY